MHEGWWAITFCGLAHVPYINKTQLMLSLCFALKSLTPWPNIFKSCLLNKAIYIVTCFKKKATCKSRTDSHNQKSEWLLSTTKVMKKSWCRV